MAAGIDKIALKELLKRLRPFADATAVGSCWAGDQEAEAAARQQLAAGEIHFAQAIRTAQAALASGDTELIKCASLSCAALERDGLKLARRFEVVQARRAGGRARGAAQTAAALERFAEWRPEYGKKIAEGKTPGTARMRRAGVRVPSDRTLQKWLTEK